MAFPTSPTVYWKLEDVNATVGGFTLTNNNSVTFVTGKVNLAGDFNGSNQSLNNNSILASTSYPRSFSCWFKADTITGSDRTVFSLSDGSVHYYVLKIRDSDDHIVFRSNNDTDAADVDTGITASTGTWYQVVVVQNSATSVTIYVNNTETNTAATTFTATVSQFYLGYLGRSGVWYFDGLIDEVGIWNKALSSGEVSSLYNSGNGASDYLTLATVSYYKLDESSGNASDSVGSNTLTNVNTVGYASAKINNGADYGSSNTNKVLRVASNLGINGGTISFSSWFNLSTLPSVGDYQTIGKQSNSSSKVAYSMRVWNDSGTYKLIFTRNRNGVAEELVSHTFTPSTGVWYHACSTYDGTNVRGYFMGTLVGTTASSGNGSGSEPDYFTLSGEYNSALTYFYPFKGLIDEVGIWSRALSAGEVFALYNAGQGQAYPLNTIAGVSNQVTDTNNDCFDDGTNIDLNGADELIMGEHPSLSIEYTGGFRFTGLAIPQGATIVEAKIRLVNDANSVGTPSLAIEGDDTDDSAVFSTHADFIGRTRTTASVAWTPGAQTAETSVTTVDIKTVVQEIVDRPGWTSGNDMGFFIKNNGGVNSWILAYDYSVSSTNSAQIQVSYSVGESFTISEVLALSETITNLRTRLFTLAENLSLSETITSALGKIFTIAENLGLVETFTATRTFVFNIAENLGIVEVLAQVKKKWNNLAKSSSSWTNRTKNNSSWTNLPKS